MNQNEANIFDFDDQNTHLKISNNTARKEKKIDESQHYFHNMFNLLEFIEYHVLFQIIESIKVMFSHI